MKLSILLTAALVIVLFTFERPAVADPTPARATPAVQHVNGQVKTWTRNGFTLLVNGAVLSFVRDRQFQSEAGVQPGTGVQVTYVAGPKSPKIWYARRVNVANL